MMKPNQSFSMKLDDDPEKFKSLDIFIILW